MNFNVFHLFLIRHYCFKFVDFLFQLRVGRFGNFIITLLDEVLWINPAADEISCFIDTATCDVCHTCGSGFEAVKILTAMVMGDIGS